MTHNKRWLNEGIFNILFKEGINYVSICKVLLYFNSMFFSKG